MDLLNLRGVMLKKVLPLVLASSVVFADGAEAAPKSGNMMQTLMLLGFGVVFFYFLLWRPEQKRRKAAEKQRSSIKKGDRVTAMGILGTVVQLRDKSVVLKMVDGSKIEMLTAAVSDVQPGTDETPEVQAVTEKA